MTETRRDFMKLTGVFGVLAATGLLSAEEAFAQQQAWNKAAFDTKSVPDTVKALGGASATESGDIAITAPDIAENGAVVPVDVASNIANTVSLAVLVDKNPLPLSSAFDFANGALPEMSLRLKMGQTSLVEVVAKTADGKYYRAKKEVKVTVGGCGG